MDIHTLRLYRIFNIAIFDLTLSIFFITIVFIIAHQIYFKSLSIIPFIIAGILLTIPIGILTHVIVGANTMLNYYLGLSKRPNRN